MFSSGICFRNADAHLLYDTNTKKRINNSKSIFVGDHVWVGQDVKVWKGTEIDSGSVIGGGSVVANKKIPHNTIYAGNPADKIRENSFWIGSCTHNWSKDQINNSQEYKKHRDNYTKKGEIDDYCFEYNEEESIPFCTIDTKLSELISPDERIAFLNNIKKSKNRFVHKFD